MAFRSNERTQTDHSLNILFSPLFLPTFLLQNAIDLDVSEMEDQLAIGTEISFANAREIYEKGGYSKSVATVTLTTPLSVGIDKDTLVQGVSASGAPVYGTLSKTYNSGDRTMEIQYKTTDEQKAYVNCQVGGLPRPNLAGCFAATGSLETNKQSVPYSYDPNTENTNKRTLKYFSETAEKKMYSCDTCPYKTFAKFREYYGVGDYADQWVKAGFEAGQTQFLKGNGNFQKYGLEARAELIQKGTVLMSVWMFVIRELENALDYCKQDCTETGCTDDAVRAWDKAVAFYTGSLQSSNIGPNSWRNGRLLYSLADEQCVNFRTCGEDATKPEGTSKVNIEIFRAFALGSRNLASAKCDATRGYKDKIEKMMTIPLIQGTLRNGFISSTGGQTYAAMGATFVASILPIVAACDENAADTIHRNMGESGLGYYPEFAWVKKAFESVYECMGITGADVGGLWNPTLDGYLDGAEPYGYVDGKPSKLGLKSSASKNTSIIIGCIVGGLVVAIIATICVIKCCCRGKSKTETKEGHTADDADITPSVQVAGDEEITPSADGGEDDGLPALDSQCEPVEIS